LQSRTSQTTMKHLFCVALLIAILFFADGRIVTKDERTLISASLEDDYEFFIGFINSTHLIPEEKTTQRIQLDKSKKKFENQYYRWMFPSVMAMYGGDAVPCFTELFAHERLGPVYNAFSDVVTRALAYNQAKKRKLADKQFVHTLIVNIAMTFLSRTYRTIWELYPIFEIRTLVRNAARFTGTAVDYTNSAGTLKKLQYLNGHTLKTDLVKRAQNNQFTDTDIITQR
jgi:hypothetical protein